MSEVHLNSKLRGKKIRLNLVQKKNFNSVQDYTLYFFFKYLTDLISFFFNMYVWL